MSAQCGKLKELKYALDKYIWDIIGLSKTHFSECGEITTEERHCFWFSSDGPDQNQVGHQLHASFPQNYYNLHLCQAEKTSR